MAEEIIERSFELLFRAVVMTVAIAFGIGGRELAARRRPVQISSGGANWLTQKTKGSK